MLDPGQTTFAFGIFLKFSDKSERESSQTTIFDQELIYLVML